MGGFACTAIFGELKKMFDVGAFQAIEGGAFALKPLVWKRDLVENLVATVPGSEPLFEITYHPARRGVTRQFRLETLLPGNHLQEYYESSKACKERADTIYAAFMSQFLTVKE